MGELYWIWYRGPNGLKYVHYSSKIINDMWMMGLKTNDDIGFGLKENYVCVFAMPKLRISIVETATSKVTHRYNKILALAPVIALVLRVMFKPISLNAIAENYTRKNHGHFPLAVLLTTLICSD
jgi:hypothetical protein